MALDVVDVTVDDEVGGATLGAVVVGSAVLVDVMTGSGVGATGSEARVLLGASTVCSTVGVTTGAGASTVCCTVGTSAGDDATDEGTSAAESLRRALGSPRRATGSPRTVGSGATVVVGTTGSSPGLAKAGAMPPVSALREMTIPDARTAHAVRLLTNLHWCVHPSCNHSFVLSPDAGRGPAASPFRITSPNPTSFSRNIGRWTDSLHPRTGRRHGGQQAAGVLVLGFGEQFGGIAGIPRPGRRA